MVRVCEHKFEAEDPNHEGYSLTEVDLFPAVGDQGEAYSMRRNMDFERVYEIFDYEHESPYSNAAVAWWGNMDGIIEKANELEEAATGNGSFQYGHSPGLYEGCPSGSFLTGKE